MAEVGFCATAVRAERGGVLPGEPVVSVAFLLVEDAGGAVGLIPLGGTCRVQNSWK